MVIVRRSRQREDAAPEVNRGMFADVSAFAKR